MLKYTKDFINMFIYYCKGDYYSVTAHNYFYSIRYIDPCSHYTKSQMNTNTYTTVFSKICIAVYLKSVRPPKAVIFRLW